MKYEDRIQLKVDELTTAFFDHVIAYYLSKPSGLGGPGCVIMVSDEGKSYQFHGPELDQLNYYSEWQLLFPILRKYLKDGRRLDDTQQIQGWKSFKVGYIGDMLILREDLYPSYLEKRGNLSKYGLDTQWEEACIKIALLANAKSEAEIGRINWEHELRKPVCERGDLVSFTIRNDRKEWPCRGRVVGCDIYRNNFKIETIEYDIWGPDFMKPNEKILYKHIDESLVKKAPGHMLIISGIGRADKDKVIKRLLERYPDEYAWYDEHNFRKINAGIYKKCYEGKTVIVDLEVDEEADFKKIHPNVKILEIITKPSNQLSKREKAVTRDCHDGRNLLYRSEENDIESLCEMVETIKP